jgi:hypothetical protein
VADAKLGKRPTFIAIAEAPPPAKGTSRERLLERDAEQRKKIAKLEARVAELSPGDEGDKRRGPEPHGFKTHPSHDELVEMAKNCVVQFDNPPLEGEAQLPPTITQRAGLNPDETAAVQKIMDQMNAQILAQLRAIYTEVTGNRAAAEELSAQALINEVHDKGGRTDANAAQAELANERAGLVPVPSDLSARSPSERMLRALSSQGDALEKAVGQVIGPERAGALRGKGWGSATMMSGCRDGTDEDAR